MCGIAGFAGVPGLDQRTLDLMSSSLLHRGPDSGGSYVREGIGLATRRLRIIDIVTGDQPIESACTGAWIVYNGELYNYRELRGELVARGHRFRTASDTEVVLHFYEEHGERAFGRLNGMFAFAIHDPRTERLVIARDHLGIKPLVYAEVGGGLVFASETKALLATSLCERTIDPRGLASYLAVGHSVDGHSIFRGIERLGPGHLLVRDRSGTHIERYWDPIGSARRWEPASALPVDEIDALVSDAVRRNMIADVGVGAFLSGGIDSGLVVALMREHTERLHTYSVGFPGHDDERRDALRLADRFQTLHTEVLVSADVAARHLPELVRIHDEPFADSADLPTYVMSRRAKEDVTVVLTGDGGDEVFGGYRRYVGEGLAAPARALPAPLLRAVGRLGDVPPLRHRTLGRIARTVGEPRRGRRFAKWMEIFTADERRDLLGASREDVPAPYDHYDAVAAETHDVRDDVTAMMLVELRTWLVDTYLEKVDKATMAASLEARVPLLDHRIVEALALSPREWKVHRGATKVLLRQVAARHLPHETIAKRKHGFGPPTGDWLRTSLRPQVEQLLDPSAAIAGMLDRDRVATTVRDHLGGRERTTRVWALLMLELWSREHVRA
jgi:asparagine synthase (glutamine-hydrolysing)